MRRGNGRDATARAVNTLETINAVATAIAYAESRLPQPHIQKKGWRSWLSMPRCFGCRTNRKRVGNVVLVPETTHFGAESVAVVSSTQLPSIALPFVAPPSSPASFLQSEPPSVAQSPAVSASMHSPGGPASIFAIGPYAHETELVSPPVFSTFTTEPSTAPFTPPPESVHLTTPSSPEVPFAQLFDPNNRNGETYQRFQMSQYDFHSYQLHPGSPIGQLISPRSAFSASGTSSPLPDSEFGSNIDKLSTYRNTKSYHGSGSLTPETVRFTTQGSVRPNHGVPEIKISPHPRSNRLNEITVNHRVSIELSTQEVLKCVENKAVAWTKALTKFKSDARGDTEENSKETRHSDKFLVTETSNGALQQTNDDGDVSTIHHEDPSLTHTSGTEFNFDNADGGDSLTPNIAADWWANEKVAGKGGGSSDNWSFFPMIQPGVS